MSEHTKIQKQIQKSFRTFGGGEGSAYNPIAAALKDKPLQFAAAVDVEQVIKVVLKESSHDALLAACKKTIKELFRNSPNDVKEDLWASIVKVVQIIEQAIAKAKKPTASPAGQKR